MIGYFYRISSGRKNGQDVSGLEAELKEKLSKLNEVGGTIEASSFFTHKHIIWKTVCEWVCLQLCLPIIITNQRIIKIIYTWLF